uniref:Putative secreted protein n=1 Tax=Panstrongylus lignarius TaxID=156445 RepID=A0A224Y0D3_9HEMI
MKNQLKITVLCLFMCLVNLSAVHTRKVSVSRIYDDNDSQYKDGGTSLKDDDDIVVSLYEDLRSKFDDSDDAELNLYEDDRLNPNSEEISSKDEAKDYGKPLFLTPYIERGDIERCSTGRPG